MGRAIRALREQLNEQAGGGLSQEVVAARAGMTRQTWSLYETGERQVVLSEDVQVKIADALNVPHDALLQAYRQVLAEQGLTPPGGSPADLDEGRSFEQGPRRGPFAPATAASSVIACLNGPSTRVTQITDDNLSPWAKSGMTIVYDTRLWPRGDEGCVIERPGQPPMVKIFVRADPETLYVRELCPEPRELTIPRAEGVTVYRVTARLD